MKIFGLDLRYQSLEKPPEYEPFYNDDFEDYAGMAYGFERLGLGLLGLGKITTGALMIWSSFRAPESGMRGVEYIATVIGSGLIYDGVQNLRGKKFKFLEEMETHNSYENIENKIN